MLLLLFYSLYFNNFFPSWTLPKYPHRPFQFSPTITAIPYSLWAYWNQMYPCTSCSETQSVLSLIRQQSHPWRDHTFPTAVNWTERGTNPTLFNKGLHSFLNLVHFGHQNLGTQKSTAFPCLKHQPLSTVWCDMVSLNFIDNWKKMTWAELKPHLGINCSASSKLIPFALHDKLWIRTWPISWTAEENGLGHKPKETLVSGFYLCGVLHITGLSCPHLWTRGHKRQMAVLFGDWARDI